MSEPKISVIMPVRGLGTFLADALRSLCRQRVPIHELLIVDDGADEQVISAIADLSDVPVTVMEGGRHGPAAARNLGIQAASGDMVGFIDDDDIWPRDKLKQQLLRLMQHPEETAVGGRSLWFSAWDEVADAPALTTDVQSVVHVNLGAFLFRRDVFSRIGLLDESHLFAEDVDFVLRLGDAREPFSVLDCPTLYYRRHPASMTASRSQREKTDFRRALFRSLGRRPRAAMAGISMTSRLVPPSPGLPE